VRGADREEAQQDRRRLDRFPGWRWALVACAAPVALWAAWPFHRAALTNARHGTATMDTLVSLGIIAACGWSVYAMFVLDRYNLAALPLAALGLLNPIVASAAMTLSSVFVVWNSLRLGRFRVRAAAPGLRALRSSQENRVSRPERPPYWMLSEW
jgi:cation transport ATPase